MEVWFPCLGGERKLVSSFSWGSLLFRAKMGRHPFRERKRGFFVLWQGVKGSAPPFPFIKCEMGLPHALFWKVIKAPARRISGQDWGLGLPCSRGLGRRVCPPFPGGVGEEVSREWIWKWKEVFHRQERQSEEEWGWGGEEIALDRWLPHSSRGWGIAFRIFP